jgi:hypothetical protein
MDTNKVITAKKWLDENEWPNLPIDSSAFSHYTYLSELMEQFAREYHEKQLVKYAIVQKSKFKKYL